MKITEYFQLTITDREARENKLRASKDRERKHVKETTLGEYYAIIDCTCSLARVRTYQLTDVLGKYKVF
jgi:hypothetical protein